MANVAEIETTVVTEDTAQSSTEAQAEELVGKLFGACIDFMEVGAIYLGDRLGFYRSLAEDGPATSVQLAERTSTHERYVREWLEQQSVAGMLGVDDVNADAGERRYSLPLGHAEVLTNPDSLIHLTPLARAIVGLLRPIDGLVEAYRTGGGVPYVEYGADTREGQAGINRPMYVNLLSSQWIPAVPDVHERLQADPPARAADIACGAGWSSISIARAYPKVDVDGFDSDEASIELARKNASDAGLDDRVTFKVHDAARPLPSGPYDLITVFEAIHDMSRPVEALRTIRKALAPRGVVIIADEKVAESFTAPGDDIERFMYGASVLLCLPTGMAEQPSAGTGAVMRPSTMRRYAMEAGFSDVEILPIENDFWRFYRLIA